MFLKGLELYGFKSFAQKTVFEFSPGITAVVGPNGSGKSNIADAILWVFGEQSAKNLRGEKMEDVIFSGTKDKSPLNMAEVSLTFDNSTGFLDSEYNELSITRRLYRSGESSYMINSTPCRRRDVLEKFMDTGLGKDAYSVISQGQINDILSARPVERRYLIEETAGISKYKSRKEEALKRLENCKDDLCRVTDILEELKTRIEPLKKQAKKAKKYKKLSEKLRVIEVNLFAKKIEGEKNKWFEINDKVSLFQKEYEKISTEKNKIEARLEKLKGDLLGIEKELENKSEENTSIIEELERKQGDKKIYQEKTNNLNDKNEKLNQEIYNLNIKVSNKKNDLDQVDSELRDLKKKLEDEEKKYQKKEKELADFKDNNTTLEDMSEDLNDIISKKSSLRTNKENLEKSIKEKEDSLKDKEKEKEKKNQEITEVKERINKINSEKKSLEVKIANLNGETQKYADYSKRIKNKENKLLKEINEKKNKLQQLKSRQETLNEVNDNNRGLSKGVREVLHKKDQGDEKFFGVLGTVSDLISIPEPYVTAIETSLGRALQNLVVSSSSEAVKVIEYLKSAKKGRVTCLPLDDLKPKRVSSDFFEKASKTSGYCGFAANLLQIEKKYKAVSDYLLGRVVVMEEVNSALNLARKINFALRIVTLEGELILPGGAMVGGSSRDNYSGNKNNEIKELKNAIMNLEKEINYKNEELDKTGEEKEKYKNELENIREKKHSVEMSLKENEKEMEGLHNELKRLQNEYLGISDDINKNKNELDKISKDLHAVKKDYEEIKSREKILKDKQEKMKKEAFALTEDRTKIEDELNQIQVEKARLSEKIQYTNEKRAGIENDYKELKSKLAELNKELKENNKELREYDLSLQELDKEITSIFERQKELSELIENLKVKRDNFKAEINELETEKSKLAKKERELDKKLDELNFKKKEIENEIKNLLDDLYEKYQITFEQAASFNSSLEDTSDVVEEGFDNAQKTISKLREQLNNLQPVNLDAIEEYNNLKNRLEFLQKQKNDLIEAETSLKEIIEDIDEIMIKRFKETAKEIDKSFREVFENLFGGGNASLKLTTPGDPLNTGVEVEARLPGKKLQNLSLLSGGEKALTVIALLLSILKIKPAPFCILDEIDASLDDKNLTSYSNYLKEFSQKTQFIVITHRKEMMQTCDSIYGLTMPRAGVSKLVSLNMDQNTNEPA